MITKKLTVFASACCLCLCLGAVACSPSGSGSSSSGASELGPGVRDVEPATTHAIADSSTYDGTDPEMIIEEHCFQCHQNVPYSGADMSSENPLTDWLLTYKAESPEAAQAVAEQMAYVCNNMSQEQIDALANYYMPQS